MPDLMVFLATAAGEEGGSSHVLFYTLGGALAAWAVLLGFLGITRPSLPSDDGGARVVMGITALLVVGACASAVITG